MKNPYGEVILSLDAQPVALVTVKKHLLSVEDERRISLSVSEHVGDVAVVTDYRSVGVAGSLAGGRVTSGSRQRDTSARDTRGSTRGAADRLDKPRLLAYLLTAAAAAVASTVTSRDVASTRRRQRFLW